MFNLSRPEMFSLFRVFPRRSFFTAAYVVRREGNSFTLLVCPQGGVSPAEGGWSGPAGGGAVRSSWGGFRSSRQGGGGQVQPGGGQVQLAGGGSGPARGGVSQQGGSASCALLRAVCLLRSRRRTFFFKIDSMEWGHLGHEIQFVESS